MRLLIKVAAAALLLATGVSAQETRSVTDDAGRVVEIPVNPQRIVSQNDNRLTLPLLELGAPVIASAGRVGVDGKPFLRTVPDLLGVDFHNSDIEFIGTYAELDFEKITALVPDLILTTRDEHIEPLSRIAPTLLVSPNSYPVPDGMARIADLVGRSAENDRLQANYQAKLGVVGGHFPANVVSTVTFSFPAGDALYVYRDLGALTVAMKDLGISQPEPFASMKERRATLSPEQLPSIDADFIINFYGSQADAGPEEVRVGLENFVPGWCDLLHACREDQYVFLPYASFGYAWSALELNVDLLTTHIAGRSFAPLN